MSSTDRSEAETRVRGLVEIIIGLNDLIKKKGRNRHGNQNIQPIYTFEKADERV